MTYILTFQFKKYNLINVLLKIVFRILLLIDNYF